VHGFFYPPINDAGNGWRHAINLPGIGSQVSVINVSFHNYQAALYGCSWCVAHRGGYEMDFHNVSWKNVESVVHFKHGVGGILVDGDGTLGTGMAGGHVVPPTGQFRTNPNCSVESTNGHYALCNATIRRVNVGIKKWTSPWWDTQVKKHYPLIIVTDVTDGSLTLPWNHWNRYTDESRVSCLHGGGCGLAHYGTPIGAEACFEQAPKMKYSFMASVGRRYLITWVDQNFIRTTADVEISATKMKPDEVMILQFSQRPPLFPRVPMRASVAQSSVELWGELDPRLGAWSPPPNMPVWAAAYQDDGGNALEQPCASGTMTTLAYPNSCQNGDFKVTGGFPAPELLNDPDIYELVRNSSELIIAGQGRRNGGGMLHPFSGPVTLDNQQLSHVEDRDYRYFCLRVKGEPSPDTGALVELNECQTRLGAIGSLGNDLQMFKYGYDYKGDWANDVGSNHIWNDALISGSDAPFWEQPLQIVLSTSPFFCLDACSATTISSACKYGIKPVGISICDQARQSQRVRIILLNLDLCMVVLTLLPVFSGPLLQRRVKSLTVARSPRV
jgi:hypothetical protein